MNFSSDHYDGSKFINPVPTVVMKKGAFFRIMGKVFQKNAGRTPKQPLGPFAIQEPFLKVPDNSLQVMWLGHSSTVIEIDGLRLLTDPLWYSRASPFKLLGPKRFFENPLPLHGLPQVDFILLSHDHYDHLDKEAILKLAGNNIPIITMLKVGARLRRWGIHKSLIHELDWWRSQKLSDNVTITATPARHFSGRSVGDRFRTLWGSFVIRGAHHNIYFGADSGYFEGFKTIGEQFGPFDLTMLEIGAYNEEWPYIHMGPWNAVKAHLDLRGNLLMPLHWGTFNLALHPWKEPVLELIEAADKSGVQLLLPEPGQQWNIVQGPINSGWWTKYA